MARPRLSRRTTAILSAIVTAALIVGIVLIVAGPATAKEFATLHPLSGTVEVRKAGGQDFATGTDGQTLRQGDTVRTGSDGRAEIVYFDGSVTRLDFDTTYELVELASMPDVPESKVIRGEQPTGRTFHRVVAITDPESRVETKTPDAVASVRGTKYVVWVHPDGTEEYWVLQGELLVDAGDGRQFIVGAGEGLRISGDPVEGPFPLTEVQLEDAFLVFNRCELDGEEEACPAEVDPEVERRNDDRDGGPNPPPLPPGADAGDEDSLVFDDTSDDGDTGGGGTSPSGPPGPPNDNNDKKNDPDPIDRRPITIRLSWSKGPANLDLHVLTPDEDGDGGGVWSGNPCLASSTGCWATASKDSREPGSETVTLRPIGDQWVSGGYSVWVENLSCELGDWGNSNATVTIRKGSDRPLPVIRVPRVGDVQRERWQAADMGVDRKGLPGYFQSEPPFAGDECAAGVEPEALKRPRGPAGPDSQAPGVDGTAETPAEEPPADEPPAEEPPPEPEPSPGPSPQPDPLPVGTGADAGIDLRFDRRFRGRDFEAPWTMAAGYPIEPARPMSRPEDPSGA